MHQAAGAADSNQLFCPHHSCSWSNLIHATQLDRPWIHLHTFTTFRHFSFGSFNIFTTRLCLLTVSPAITLLLLLLFLQLFEDTPTRTIFTTAFIWIKNNLFYRILNILDVLLCFGRNKEVVPSRLCNHILSKIQY